MNALERITRSRTRMLLDFPWFGQLAMRLKLVEDASIPTMAVDGTHLFFNPEFTLNQTDAHIQGILAHETMHCALGHMYRRGARSADQWNISTDHAINLDLIASGFSLPSDCLADPKYKSLSAEVIYAQLSNNKQDNPQSKSDGKDKTSPALSTGTVLDAPQTPQDQSQGKQPSSGIGNDKSNAPSASNSEKSQDVPLTAEDWKILVEQTTFVCSKAGNAPADAVRSAKAARESTEDWRATLREFIQQTQPTDYSWSAPNRRHIANGLYLPGTIKENIGTIAVAVDTSGSISAKLLDLFASEIKSILEEAQPERVDVVYCDTRVRHTEEFTPEDLEIKLSAKGGGGTRFQPVFEHLNAQDSAPLACVFFTDLDNGSERLTEPDYPVLWVTGRAITRSGSFGQTIRVDSF